MRNQKKRTVRLRCMTVCCIAMFLTVSATPVFAEETGADFQAEYEAISYDTYDGLVSAEINTIAQTEDGYIWVGTYSGLYRYDGVRFEKANLDERISSVMVLFVDSAGRLWIGTNDSGLCCYVPETGETQFYTTENGLASYSIRALSEDDAGNIYVGTVSLMTVIDADGVATCREDMDDINSVRSLCSGKENVIAGVTNDGTLFFLKDGELILEQEFPEEGIYYASVGSDDAGTFAVGTSGNEIEYLTFAGDQVRRTGLYDTGGIAYYNDLLYDEEHGGFFFCAENGLGLLKKGGGLTDLTSESFDSSISDVIKDYQGNIWFVSNKQGVLEFSRDPFMNVFVRAGLPGAVVNSLMVKDGEIYIAMDNGLAILDAETYEKKDYDFLSYFDDVRVRHLMEDSHGNIWISTYGQDGLIRVDRDGEATLFNEATAGTLGGRFRYVLELSDGTVLAASNTGLTGIRGDEVIGTIGEDDGLNAPQILTMVEMPDGTVLAGSDGDGIYRIRDMQVTGHIGIDEGLETLVVLRIVPCRDGYLYVTSNALYYDDGQEIRRLNAFPYTNNYDIYISDEDEAWVSSSAGIFIVQLDDLLENGEYHYELLDYSRGFTTTLTANAWNTLLDLNGNLLLCCTDGVRQISTREYDASDSSYDIRVHSVICDDTPITENEEGTYVIPSSAKRIEIAASVLNFDLSNPLVRLYLEGAADEGTTVYQNDLSPLSYTNLPYGAYTLHIQILDGTEYTVLRDETFPIYKEARFTELPAVRFLGIALLVAAAGLFVWWVLRSTIIRRQYEEIRLAKDEAERANTAKSRFLANMSHEIRTPINTIMGMDEMILREDKNEPKSRYASAVLGYAVSIKRASESLLGLVNDILDLSKIESGKMNLVEQEYDTVELLRSITTMIRVRSNEKDLGFSTEIDPGLPAKLYGDDGKIKQVLLNLLTNAVKYTEKGSFTLRMKLEERTAESVTIRYSVRDTGIGIRPEDMDKLFSAFERLDEKRNSGIQGTGLGLDISRQFVELMGDELRCDSVYGEGSTFYFTLRQGIVDESPIGEFTERDESGDAAGGAYVPLFVAPEAKLLVVDDNEMNLQVLSGLLRSTRVQLDTALSGRECLKKLSEHAYHLVLLDHMMPEMDGIETLHALREDGHTLPVIALTANSAENGESYYVSEGFCGYLSKPVDGRKLEETLQRFLPEEVLLNPLSVDAAPDDEEDAKDAQLLPEWLYETEGIIPAEGVKNCGSEEAFLSALQTFYDTLPEKADEIEKAYVAEDWDFYTIKVHALKSSARIIGASELSALAEALEAAGKAQDIDTIRRDSGHLLLDYRAYSDKLERLSEDDAADKEEIDPETLAEAYEALTELSAVMDYDSVEMVLDSVKEYRLPEQDEKRIKELRIKLKELDWEAVSSLLADR